MTTVIVTVALADQTFPGNTPPVASYRVSIHQGALLDTTVATQDVPPTEPIAATFANVPDGSYTAVAQAIDGAGNTIGDALKQAFNASTPDITMKMPATLNVTVS